MHFLKSLELSRREMMIRSGQLAIVGSAASYALGLSGISDAAALNSDGSYKALVCIFLYGGNDHANTLVPFDEVNHALYQKLRPEFALSRTSLSGTVLKTPSDQQLTNDIQYALPSYLPSLKKRFDEGNLAVILNVGPLLTPLTKAQYLSSNTTAYPRPPKLFSHNDQQSTWQSFVPEGATIGWGGRLGDLAQSANTNSMFTTISATGNAVFLSGNRAYPYRVSPGGAIVPRAISSGRLFDSRIAGTALKNIVEQHHQHVFEQDYQRVTIRSLQYGDFINDALGQSSIATAFPNTSLANQLELVARLISVRAKLSVTRQVFLVSLGSFDHHRGLAQRHPEMMAQLDGALDAFHRATIEMGVAHQVTSFTASDFGRTLSSNGDGSDHGWGGHHFVMGGAVNGGRYYGTAPLVSTTSDDQVGGGRLLPTISVDEYSTTLALWLGVSPGDLPMVAPNIGRFARPDLGFMKGPPQAA